MPDPISHRLILCTALALLLTLAAGVIIVAAAAPAAAAPPGAREYLWAWYDQQSAGTSNWVLVANPAAAAASLQVSLAIAGVDRDLSAYHDGLVPAGRSITPSLPGVMGGPVSVVSLTGARAVASQRVLWGGASLEEVPGMDAERLASDYYWTWYDQLSPGYVDWILVANPNPAPIFYRIQIAGVQRDSGVIEPGRQETPTFPGVRGGPVEVESWSDAVGGALPAEVIASQRVLSDYGGAFNEVPGYPAGELASHYYWTWYDRAGGENWLLIANPLPTQIFYRIQIAGVQRASGVIEPGRQVTPTFPGVTGGPVEVEAWSDAVGGSLPADVIASQRVVWGASFEEVPGIPADQLSSDYHWAWYDQLSGGAVNWVLVANPQSYQVFYEIRVAGTVRASGAIQPGGRVTPTFPALMGGPVEVRAYADAARQTPVHVISSQRVLWSGHFNEVTGTELGAEAPPAPATQPVFPADNIWNTPVDTLPMDPNSDAYVNSIGAADNAHPDFGSGLWDGGPIGIPFVEVSANQPRAAISFYYPDESDPGPYPIPPGAPIEGGPDANGDRHILVIDRDNNILYEVYDAWPQPDGSWAAGSGAIFDLNSNALRSAGWTSADAAGLPIYPGLVRYDEVAGGEIRHALRFTAPRTRDEFIWPARHLTSEASGYQYPPMGQRFRLKADYDISGFSPEVRIILTAMQRYGIILADNGSPWYISGAPDERWDNDNLHELSLLSGSDFEAVDESSLMVDPDSAQAGPG